MKRRAEPIDVTTVAGRPVLLRRGQTRLPVLAVIDAWTVRGRWWACEEERRYFRLETAAGVLDVYLKERQWYLSRIVD